ncbi:hypothetical protein PMAYCL1PPCAC_25325, partial [Pristionchus mayeri]
VTVISRRLPYSTMPSADEVARAAKTNLQSSLSITHNLTLSSSAPSDFVLHRMNEVLRAVIDANFDTPSMDALGALYAAIGEAQPHMVNKAHDLALVNLSRTFAVVIEEAIKIKRKPTGSTGNNNNTSGNAADGSGFGAWKASNGSYGKPPATNLKAGGAQPLKGFGPQLSKTTAASGAKTAAAAAPISAAEMAQRKKREEEKDYSPEAVKGRITVFKIPIPVTELQLRAHFSQIGEIQEVSYPIENGKHKGFALMRFKDNATADEAVARLNGGNLGGAQLSIERARFWFKRDKKPVAGAFRANAGSGSAPGSGKPAREGDQSGHVATPTSASSSHMGTVLPYFSVPVPQSRQESDQEAADYDDDESTDYGSDPGIM